MVATLTKSNSTNRSKSERVRLLSKDRNFYEFEFFCMGTNCYTLFRSESYAKAREFKNLTVKWLRDFERKYSRFLPDSIISKINQNAGIKAVDISQDKDLKAMIKLTDWFHWLTDGLFDITSLPLTQLWQKAQTENHIPSETAIEQALNKVNWRDVHINDNEVFLKKRGMMLDLGGIGKEYAVDEVFRSSERLAIHDIMLSFGQDIRAKGQAPQGGKWRIGLENPCKIGSCWNGVFIDDHCVATSGNYFRFFEINGKKFSHIINPQSGLPKELPPTCVYVLGNTCVEAGIFSTVSFMLEVEKGIEFCQKSSQIAMYRNEGGRLSGTNNFNKYLIQNTND